MPSVTVEQEKTRIVEEWTKAQDAILCSWWLSGASREDIAAALFGQTGSLRSPASISTRASRLGLPPREPGSTQPPRLPHPLPQDHLSPQVFPAAKLRKCLGPQCGKHFWSEHAGIRLCSSCSGRIATLDDGITMTMELCVSWRSKGQVRL